jgi:hypothetical protein
MASGQARHVAWSGRSPLGVGMNVFISSPETDVHIDRAQSADAQCCSTVEDRQRDDEDE